MDWIIPTRLEVSDDIKIKLFNMILAQGSPESRMNKVELIKLVRFELQKKYPSYVIGLKEAKDLVELLCERLYHFIASGWNNEQLHQILADWTRDDRPIDSSYAAAQLQRYLAKP